MGMGLTLTALRPPLKKHVEGCQEKKDAAGDAECWHGYPHEAQDCIAEKTEDSQQNCRGKTGTERNGSSPRSILALGQSDEQRRQSDRIDNDDKRHEGCHVWGEFWRHPWG